MSEKNIKSRIIHKHDTEANWNKATSFKPLKGEIIVYDIDSNYNYERIKIGDGDTTVVDLPFINDALKPHGVYYIEGGGTTDTTNKVATWTGSHTDIESYYNGLAILYKISTAGSTSTTLNINNLGAVAVVRNATTAISTAYAVNSVVMLIYTTDDSGMSYWKVADYDANTKNTTGTSNKVGTKMFLVGGTSQSSSATTYSNKNVYIGTDNCVYSNGEKVATVDEVTAVSDLIGDTAVATQIENAMANKSDVGHTHEISELTDLSGASVGYADEATHATTADTASAVAWDNITGKPSAYAPAAHSHAISDVTNLQTTLDSKVPTSRTVNGKALSTNITLSASDVGADVGGSASSALANAKSYTDAKIDQWIGDTTVANQINSAIATKADSNHTHPYATTGVYYGTFSATSWSYDNALHWHWQYITVNGILPTDMPLIDVNLSAVDVAENGVLLQEAWGHISRIITTTDAIIAYCYGEKPIFNIPVIIKVVR